MENRIINIEMILANMQKTIDELNEVVVKQSQQIDHLQKINAYILDSINQEVVKPLQEEVPPPHY
jgi:uncharacterized coiled-coil protein SlyX